MSYDAEIERIVAEHAAASARIWAEIARIDAESAWRSAELAERVRVEAEAAVANEAGGTEPKSPQPAKRLPPLADDWDNDEESKYYRPKSWLI